MFVFLYSQNMNIFIFHSQLAFSPQVPDLFLLQLTWNLCPVFYQHSNSHWINHPIFRSCQHQKKKKKNQNHGLRVLFSPCGIAKYFSLNNPPIFFFFLHCLRSNPGNLFGGYRSLKDFDGQELQKERMQVWSGKGKLGRTYYMKFTHF